MNITHHPIEQRLRSQINDFRLQISDLLEREAQLRKHALPLLRAKYEKAIGVHEFKLLKIRIEVLELKFRIERLIAILNRGEEIIPDHLTLLEQDIREVREQWQLEIADKERLLHASLSFLKTSSFLTRDESDRLKQLYRKVCLLLHPDLNGNSDTHALFWNNVQAAYASGDIDRLETLLIAVQTHGDLHYPDTDSAVSELEQERDRLESLVLEHLRRLQDIGKNPPFCLEEDLNNPEWIKMKQTELRQSTKEMVARRDELRAVYDDIIEYNGIKVH